MDDIRKALAAHGKRRAAARKRVLEESQAIAKLVPAAREAGIPKTEIAHLAQVSRPALDAMLRASA